MRRACWLIANTTFCKVKAILMCTNASGTIPKYIRDPSASRTTAPPVPSLRRQSQFTRTCDVHPSPFSLIHVPDTRLHDQGCGGGLSAAHGAQPAFLHAFISSLVLGSDNRTHAGPPTRIHTRTRAHARTHVLPPLPPTRSPNTHTRMHARPRTHTRTLPSCHVSIQFSVGQPSLPLLAKSGLATTFLPQFRSQDPSIYTIHA